MTTGRRWTCRRCPSGRARVSDVLVETLVAWGVDTVFGMVGPLQPRLRRGAAPGRGARRPALRRHPARGCSRIRRLRVRQADRPPGRVLRDRRTGLDQPAHRPLRRHGSTAPRSIAISGQVPLEGPGPGRVPGRRPVSGVPRRHAVHGHRARGGPTTPSSPRQRSSRRLDGRGVAHLVLPDEVQDTAIRRPCRPARAGAGPTGGGTATGDTGPRRSGCCATARRPVLVVGEGARSAADEVRSLAERLGAPVLTTFRAKGLLPDTHPLAARRARALGHAGRVAG